MAKEASSGDDFKRDKKWRSTMVYSIRTNVPMTTKVPLKVRRTRSEHAKKVENYMASHRIVIKTDSEGKVVTPR